MNQEQLKDFLKNPNKEQFDTVANEIINGIKIDIILPTIPLQYSNVLNPKNSITTSISILSSL